ncbi:MAG: hypothetical protein ACREXR_10450 [Gammaproteobacteria bacterium]
MPLQRSIDGLEALYRKLERTFYHRPGYGEYQVDWVVDVEATAWHLVDWVARDTNGDVKTAQERLKKKCPELAVREQVCNGAKHFVLGNQNLKPFKVATDVQTSDGRVGISKGGRGPGDDFDMVLTPAVSITDKDLNSWEAIRLFHKVLLSGSEN